MSDLRVIGGEQVLDLLAGRDAELVEAVRAAYLAHADGRTSLPHSSFLLLPGRPADRIIALPATLVASRMQGDAYHRVDRVVFKIPEINVMQEFTKGLTSSLRTSHRLQDDFRIDDIAARVRKRQSQGQVYNIIFMLAGIVSLIGGGMVNVNIQLATLKERVREVGVKMAIGASGREIFKEFMTEAMLLSGLGAVVGFLAGVIFSKTITAVLEIPLYMDPKSFVWAFLLAGLFGFAFALYPAFKASRQSPMEALRYE